MKIPVDTSLFSTIVTLRLGWNRKNSNCNSKVIEKYFKYQITLNVIRCNVWHLAMSWKARMHEKYQLVIHIFRLSLHLHFNMRNSNGTSDLLKFFIYQVTVDTIWCNICPWVRNELAKLMKWARHKQFQLVFQIFQLSSLWHHLAVRQPPTLPVVLAKQKEHTVQSDL